MADKAACVFDLGALALAPETLAELAEARKQAQLKRVRPARPEAFVKLPYERTLAAAGRLGNAPLAVLVELPIRRSRPTGTWSLWPMRPSGRSA